MTGKKTLFKNVIIGIDPGSITIGYGVIGIEERAVSPTVIDYGYISLGGYNHQAERLLNLNKDLKTIFKKYKPQSVAIENVYFFKNAKTFIAVSEAKGVILFTAAKANIQINEYTPLQVKQTISG